MRFILVLVSVLMLLPDAQGQLLGRRRRCPDCGPNNYTPRVPGVNPENEVAPDPEPDLSEMEKIIPPECRVQNRGPNCGWCALEDVFVAAGYQNFKGLRQRANEKNTSPHGIGPSAWKYQLDQAKVQYKFVENHDYSIFDHAKQEGVGVAVMIPNHAVVCCGLTDQYAYILDNNGPLKVQRWSRQEFNRKWKGIACCPLFHKHPKQPKPEPAPAPTPTVQPLTGAQGPAGPQGPPGKDGTSPDLGPLSAKLDSLAATVTKMNDNMAKVQTNVGVINSTINVIDQRVSALERQTRTRLEVLPGPPQ